MNGAMARESGIFQYYLFVTTGILILAGIILSFITWVLKKKMHSIWMTWFGWVIMIPLTFGAIYLGRTALVVLLGLVMIFGFKEYSRATGLYRDWWMTGSVYLAMIATCVVILIPHPDTPGQLGWYGMYMTLPVFTIALILLIPILRNRVQGQLQSIALATLGYIYLGWMFSHTAFLANDNNPERAYGYLLFLLVAVELNDVAAFTFGKLFGKHTLRSKISPRKTWEGALGAFTISMLLPWLLRFSFPHFGTLQLVLTGLIIGVGGQLGDLSISVIKRDIGIKDMGTSIPGHGGILDRIDSLIYTAPLFLHMVDYYYQIW